MPQRYNRNRMYGRGYRQYDPTYQAAGFNPAVFEGTSVEFKPYDYSIYERGLANLEARMDKAAEQQGAVDLTLAEIETKLNPAEREWFSSYKHDIKNQIQSEIDAGNFGSAIRKAIKLGKQAASDSRILGRAEENAKYQEAVNDVMSNNKLDKDTKDWWLATHPYSYTDAYDANGNPISNVSDGYNDRPVDPVDITKLGAEAISLVAPTKSDISGSTTNTGGIGNKTTSNGQPLTGSSFATAIQELTEDRLKEVFDAVFLNAPGAKEYIIQNRNVSLWKYKQLEDLENNAATPEEKLNYANQKELYKDDLYDKGMLMGETEYIAKHISPILHNAAYRYVTTSSGKHYGASNKSDFDNDPANPEDYPTGNNEKPRTVGGGTVNIDRSEDIAGAKATVKEASNSTRTILEIMDAQDEQVQSGQSTSKYLKPIFKIN